MYLLERCQPLQTSEWLFIKRNTALDEENLPFIRSMMEGSAAVLSLFPLVMKCLTSVEVVDRMVALIVSLPDFLTPSSVCVCTRVCTSVLPDI